jgi:hypothetical protein
MMRSKGEETIDFRKIGDPDKESRKETSLKKEKVVDTLEI